MNKEKVLGLVRHVLTSVGGGAILLGMVDESTVTSLVGAAMTIIGFVASWNAREKKV